MSSSIENTVALVKDNIGRVVVGKTDAIELLLVALICEGHVLLEDDDDAPPCGLDLLEGLLQLAAALALGAAQQVPHQAGPVDAGEHGLAAANVPLPQRHVHMAAAARPIL